MLFIPGGVILGSDPQTHKPRGSRGKTVQHLEYRYRPAGQERTGRFRTTLQEVDCSRGYSLSPPVLLYTGRKQQQQSSWGVSLAVRMKNEDLNSYN